MRSPGSDAIVYELWPVFTNEFYCTANEKAIKENEIKLYKSEKETRYTVDTGRRGQWSVYNVNTNDKIKGTQ